MPFLLKVFDHQISQFFGPKGSSLNPYNPRIYRKLQNNIIYNDIRNVVKMITIIQFYAVNKKIPRLDNTVETYTFLFLKFGTSNCCQY